MLSCCLGYLAVSHYGDANAGNILEFHLIADGGINP